MGVFACIGAGGCDYSWLYFAPKWLRDVEAVQEDGRTHNRTVELSRATLKPSTLSPPQTRS
jgi:hypothetical protein